MAWTPDTHELAWAAGFFDGEGHIASHPHTSKGYRNARKIIFSVGQADPRPLERMQEALGGPGAVRGPYQNPKRPEHQPTWTYQIGRWEHIQAAIAAMWPWLSPPKRDQATKALVLHRDASHKPGNQGDRRELCKKGLHSMEDALENGRQNRRCRYCARANHARYYARHRERISAERRAKYAAA